MDNETTTEEAGRMAKNIAVFRQQKLELDDLLKTVKIDEDGLITNLPRHPAFEEFFKQDE